MTEQRHPGPVQWNRTEKDCNNKQSHVPPWMVITETLHMEWAEQGNTFLAVYMFPGIVLHTESKLPV